MKATEPQKNENPGRHNTLLLMADEHNPFVSTPHGHPMVRTPHMQAMADEGAWFENAYCPSPLCTPSRTSFMTGRHVHQHRMYSNLKVDTNFDYPSFGGVLHHQGVHTVTNSGAVYCDPEKTGFSEFLSRGQFKGQGGVFYERQPLAIRPGARERAKGFGPREDAFQRDEQRLEAALDWLKNSGATMDQPWVLCVNVSKPHFPVYSTPDLWEAYRDAEDLPAFGVDQESARHPYAEDLRHHFELDHFTPDQARGLRRGYLGCVSFVDQALGRLRQTLEALGLSDSTNLIYTSDHGEMLGKFGLWWKCSLFEDSARVPLLATGPDFAGRGRVTTPVTLHDVQASFFRGAGAVRPDDWVGEPLQDLPNHDPDRVVFSEYHGHGTRSGAYLVRRGDWKLIYCTEAPNLLFNLAEDPNELHDLHQKNRDQARAMEALLREICDPEKEDARSHAFQRAQGETLKAATG